jgi:hypothetical protein
VKLKDAHLVNFHGRRFNVVFENGAAWYALVPQVVAFLWQKRRADGGLNRLLQAVLEKFTSSEMLAGLKVRKCFTSPSRTFKGMQI